MNLFIILVLMSVINSLDYHFFQKKKKEIYDNKIFTSVSYQKYSFVSLAIEDAIEVKNIAH